jgi:ABC-type transport system involved in multi-copper enzyme maturation permease subunit
MLARISAIAMNAYREAVRARVLYGLLAFALAACGYAVIVASLSIDQQARVISDVGAASISLCAVLVAIVLGATSLYRELELKTIFPILARPLHRHEYLVGKYLGILLTLVVFVALDGALVLGILAVETGASLGTVLGAAGGLLAMLALLLLRFRRARVQAVVPWSLVTFTAMAWLAAPAGPNRQVVLASCVLTLCESAIITAVATLFSSFSSPFLTAIFTLSVFLIGRSADTLAHLPARQVGAMVKHFAAALARVVPNLQVYVPARPVLLGQVPGLPTWPLVAKAAAQSCAYSIVLIAVATLIFRRRDFS